MPDDASHTNPISGRVAVLLALVLAVVVTGLFLVLTFSPGPAETSVADNRTPTATPYPTPEPGVGTDSAGRPCNSPHAYLPDCDDQITATETGTATPTAD